MRSAVFPYTGCTGVRVPVCASVNVEPLAWTLSKHHPSKDMLTRSDFLPLLPGRK